MSTSSKNRLAQDEIYVDEYEYYEDLFDPLRIERGARRRRKPKPRHVPKKPSDQVITETAEVEGLEGGFNPTYHPSLHEEAWLLSSLGSFYHQELISDVLMLVKGGKEATVYCCEAHPSTGLALLAAKVYRPRQFRTMRNDAVYRRGRQVLTSGGRPVKKNEHRIMRAIGKKTTFGVQVMQTSWLMHEYAAMEQLYQAGGAVPQPIAVGENAILMGYYGDARMAAPTLNEVDLEPDEVAPLFQEVLRNVELMLHYDLIHGDLSAYNILYWAGEITIIDFPQVTDCQANPDAYTILRRDVERVCEYFARQGVQSDHAAIVDDLWSRYGVIEEEGGFYGEYGSP